MSLEKENKELKERLSIYEADVAAQFYKSLVTAVQHLNMELGNKTLNFDEDTFAKSVLTLSEKSGKIFEGLKQGKEAFTQSEGDDKDRFKKLAKAGKTSTATAI